MRIAQLEPRVLGAPADDKNSGQAERDEYKKLRNEADRLWKIMKNDAGLDIVSVWFNAWQFEDSKQIWAGLASQISKELERKLPWHSQQWLRIKYAWKERRTELLLNILLPFAVLCLVAGMFSVGYLRNMVVTQKLDSFGGLLQLLVPAGSALLTIWFFSSQVVKVAKPMSERVLSYVSLPSYRDQLGFQHRVMDDLDFIFKFVKQRRRECKVVVYIDDLDRCSENKIMEILQAINLILANCKFFVFVGMNMEIIERAIESHYKDKKIDELADYYLSKIIQISLDLPKTGSLGNYLDTLFSPQSRYQLKTKASGHGIGDEKPITTAPHSSPGGLSYDLNQVLKIVPVLSKEAEDSPDELEAFRDYSAFLENNPRKILRLINTHRLIKLLMPGSAWHKKRQRKLVIWRIFCHKWPELTQYAIESPQTDNALWHAVEKSQEVGLGTNRSEISPQETDLAKRFVKFKPEDALSSDDIDKDFRLAAELMKLVR